MIRASQIALLALLIASTLAAGAIAWAAWDVHLLVSGIGGTLNSKTGILARAEGLETKANATLVNLDKGTAIWAAAAKDQAGAVENLATDAHGTLSEANRAIQGINPVTASLTDEIGALHKTTDAATTATQALSGVLTRAQGTTDAATQALTRASDAVDDLDAVLRDQAIHQTLESTAATSRQLAALSTDLEAYAHPILNPDPCKTKKCTAGRIVSRVGGYLGIASTAFSASQWARPLPVKVSK